MFADRALRARERIRHMNHRDWMITVLWVAGIVASVGWFVSMESNNTCAEAVRWCALTEGILCGDVARLCK